MSRRLKMLVLACGLGLAGCGGDAAPKPPTPEETNTKSAMHDEMMKKAAQHGAPAGDTAP